MEEEFDLENYERFIAKLNNTDGGHWEKLQKRTATLFEYLLENNDFHKLQKIILEKNLKKLPKNDNFDFSATDRDATLDIPYMN